MRWPAILSAVTLLTLTAPSYASPTPFSSHQSTSSSWSPSAFLRKQTADAVDSVKHVLEGIDRWTHKKQEDHHSHSIHGSDGKVEAWNVHSHEALPGVSLRIKPTEGLCDKNVKQYVGYLDVDGNESGSKHFFFWFFESRRDPAKDPVILWLNGGPGCSSLTGLFMELGPCRVSPTGNGTINNPSSWNNEANVIFLDQPINVGFSYGDQEEVSNTVDAAKDVYAFLQLFFQSYPKYSELDLHITGESYAGHYVPAIGKAILKGNDYLREVKEREREMGVEAELMKGLKELKLKSLAIGNGLTDPLVQYKYYPEFAADETYGPVLDDATIDGMRSKYPTCANLIKSCYKTKSTWSCVPAAIYCNNALISPFQSTGLNIYDIREKCDTAANPLCYSILTDIEIYLNRAEVQKQIGVERAYEGCKRDINMKFMMAGDWMKPYVEDLVEVLEGGAGVRVLVYAGDADFIWMGNKAYTLELPWAGQDGFVKAQDLPWVSEKSSKKVGEFRTFGQLTFLRVFEAGHMVPYDQPENSDEMVRSWLKEGKFLTV
ncbi:hypothetical protein HK097_000830 [Rhizophlyctis rosea]|uniref:Carboxypeptidase n=1 Tax=Rhizophlyctis rosea TaxID=64517 RepID=A0AAD5S7K4_9FUNG|nr:hypothetical protein HK097_000830 [Rhizophlyctis rosea]